MHSLVGGRQVVAACSRFRLPPSLSVLGLLVCGALSGCDDSKGSGAEPERDAGFGPAALETVLQLDSKAACRIDAECAADLHCFQGACVFECSADSECEPGHGCSPRRRCETGEAEGARAAATPDAVPGVNVLLPPPEVVQVAPGQKEVKLTFKTSAAVTAGVLGYTVERYAYKDRKATPPKQVFRTKGADSFEIVVPTGSAGAKPKGLLSAKAAEGEDGQEPGIEEVQIVTSVGTFRMTLLPQPSPAGHYAGTVTSSRFGQVGLPLDFEIVTDPADVELAEAAHVYLVLPVNPGSILAPIAPPADGSITAVATELSYQDFTQQWTGTLRAPFDFPADSLLARYGTGKVIRGLRFSISVKDNAATGTVRDTWEGLYDARTADGVVSPSTLVMEGKLDLSRVGPARGLDTLPAVLPRSTVALGTQSLPDVARACTDTLFDVDEVLVGSTAMNCEGIGSAADFSAASSDVRTRCAIAVAENALAGPHTTAALISAFLQGDTDTTGQESFSDFMKRCAAGTDGACRPSPEVLCGRAATAYAAATQATPDTNFAGLLDVYTRATREAFLGRELAAYQADADTRLSWLKSQNYPAVVSSQVRDLNVQLINDWKANVLEAHFGSLSGQYDENGLAVLARGVQDQTLLDQRQLLLLEMTQSWRSAMEALTVATRRWNDVYQDVTSRAAAADYVSRQAFDLYVLGGVADQLNQSAGSGYASAGLAAGFSSLLSELRRLSLPFSKLVFDRDAEVVMSRSLNPLSTEDTLLSDIQASAMSELERATRLVDGILERAQQQAVDEQLLRNDLSNQVDQHFDELITLCGMPEGCKNADREKPECWPLVKAGECGFGTEVKNLGTAEVPQLTVTVVDFTSSSNVSDAGEAILEVRKAAEALKGSQLAYSNYRLVTAQMLTTNTAQQAAAAALSEKRMQSQAELDALWEQVGDAQASGLSALKTYSDQLRTKQADALAERTRAIMQMNALRDSATAQDISDLRAVTALSQTASTLDAAAERAEKIAGLTAGGLPKSLDDFAAPIRMALNMAAYGVTTAMDIAAQGLQVAAESLEVERQARAAISANMLTKLELKSEVDTLMAANELSQLQANLQVSLQKNATAEQQARDAILMIEGELEAEAQAQRDLSAMYNRRDDVFARIVGENDRATEIQQAQYTLQQRQTAYLRVVQRAQLLDGRLRNLVAQRTQLNQNLGSPSVVFGWANQLEQAESRLERAKDKMMDWVVALEYLAVRPFMDARLQILLARNTYQLADIAASLEDIQSRCGGAINTNSAVLSLRDDVLQTNASLRDSATGEVLSAAETFRAILARAQIPGDTRVRFSADATIGDLLARGGIWAASFDLGLNDFANLGASCNAKIQDISIQLVGTDLGGAQPTVGLAYDGSSTVRSCQPDIDAIVDGIGRDATAFSAVTLFRTPGRVLAPTAGINAFGQPNQTLVGLPLASQYTVIIDPTLGENASIKWDRLEDVRISVNYAYQDFYPPGQCH